MPNVKITELVDLLERQIAELKEGDPIWTKEQKTKAKDAIEMMKAFKVLSVQQCTDQLQSIPGTGGPPSTRSGKKSRGSGKK